VFAGTDPGEHQQLGAADAARRQDHFPFSVHQMHPAIAQQLHTCSSLGGRVNDHFGHVRLHCHVQIGPEPSWPEKSLGRTAPRTSPDRSLLYSSENIK